MSLRDMERAYDQGAKIGAFVVRGTLGAGGSGVVFEVRDTRRSPDAPSLALKLFDRAPDVPATRRLQAHAELAMALRHPNVVTTHDVGIVDGRVYQVMDLIRGPTLARWAQTEHPRPWTELLPRWIEAGRGLEAAHALGLLHCDFKPSNAVISEADERVVLVDFVPEPEALWQPEPGDRSEEEASADDQAKRATILGTARYMAPERWTNDRVDARGDQFAFCVSLWETLFGRHPFAETTNLLVLARAAMAGELVDAPVTPAVPDRLRRILTRGLALEPEDRFRDMSALLAELEGLLQPSTLRRWLTKLAPGS